MRPQAINVLYRGVYSIHIMEGPLLDIPLCCCTCIDFAAITLEEEEEEEAEESGDSDEEIGLDYLSKDIGSVRITIS